MKEYVVQKPFMARAGQFEISHTLCIGIEKNALAEFDEYRCYLGKNRKTYYDITYAEALELIIKYGENNVVWQMRGKSVFILPIKDFRKSEHQEGGEAQ